MINPKQHNAKLRALPTWLKVDGVKHTIHSISHDDKYARMGSRGFIEVVIENSKGQPCKAIQVPQAWFFGRENKGKRCKVSGQWLSVEQVEGALI